MRAMILATLLPAACGGDEGAWVGMICQRVYSTGQPGVTNVFEQWDCRSGPISSDATVKVMLTVGADGQVAQVLAASR